MALKDLIRRLEDFLGVNAPQDAREDAGGGDTASSPRRREALRHGLNLALRATISIGLLAWVISGIDLRAAGAVMLRANLLLVPVIFALVIAERLLASLRWYLLVRGDPRVTYWRITRLLFTTTFAGFFFPGTVGVELLRVYSLGRGIANIALAFSSVLVERIQALTALAALTLVALISAPPGMPPEIEPAAWIGLCALVGGTALLLWRPFRDLTYRLLPGARLEGLRFQLAKVYDCLDLYRRQPGPMALGLLVALAFQVLRILQVVVGAWALGIDLPVQYYFVIMPTIILLTLLPISIAAGLGVREAAFVHLFGLVGMAGDAAFSLSLFVYVISFSAGLPGAWMYARSGLKLA
jgi:glycosyltransferase 2 family protein